MIVAINKPKGPSSFAIIAQARKITGVKKIGHAGTLDPLAAGVLIVAIGREDTKKINFFVNKEKEYEAEITLGQESATDDDEGEKKPISGRRPTEKEIRETLPRFIGEIIQVPPKFSAIKVGGQRAYKLARAGRAVKLKPRQAMIKKIELLRYAYPILKIRVVTGPGVYIRSLARDLGRELGCGAYMSGLIRTRVGDFTLKDALTLENFEKFYDSKKSVN